MALTAPLTRTRAVPTRGQRRKAHTRAACAVVLAAGLLGPAAVDAQTPTVRARGQAVAPRAGSVPPIR